MNKELHKSVRSWNSFIEMNSLDFLQQLGGHPWRITSHLDYEAQLVVDVSHDRRYFGLTLLICRNQDKCPSFWIDTIVEPKPDSNRETINEIILRDKIVEIFNRSKISNFESLSSVLALRDGRECGGEINAILEAQAQLKKLGILSKYSMSTEWLTMQSFQQSQELLDAINTLSIHLKLKLAGIKDEESEQALTEANEKLSSFFRFIDKVFNEIAQVDDMPLKGMDPRQRQLVRSFGNAKKNKRKYHSDLFRKSPKAVEKLLDSKNPQEQKLLIESLSELRTLVEEHIGEDARKVIGEI